MVALLHLVSVLGWIGPLLVSLAVGSPAATSLATASSWHSSARPAQRRPAPLHPSPSRKMPERSARLLLDGGELECTEGKLRDERGTHERRRAPTTERSFYGIIQQRQHGTARLGQLPLAHTTHSVTQSGLSRLPTHLTYGFGRTHLQKLICCIDPLY